MGNQARLIRTRAADNLQPALIELGLTVDGAGTRNDAVTKHDAVVKQRGTADGNRTGDFTLEQLGLISKNRARAQTRRDAEIAGRSTVRDELQETVAVLDRKSCAADGDVYVV